MAAYDMRKSAGLRSSRAVDSLPEIGENEEIDVEIDLTTGVPVAPEELHRRMTVDDFDEPERLGLMEAPKELHGWLNKESRHIKTMRKRYFLVKDRQLMYFKKDTDPTPHFSMPLSGCTVSPMDRGRANDYFRIDTPAESMVLQCASERECQLWVTQLQCHIAEANRKVTLESFELVSVIGRGAFGKVMLVRKLDNKKLYAMKVMHKAKLIKQKLVNQILDENNILRIIEHPYVVGLQFAFQTETEVYLVMDYINGGDMFGQMQKHRRFQPDAVRLYVAEMVLAFEHIHKQGIVYRDLKPENVLMDRDGHLRLTDFGLSKMKMDYTDKTHTFCGSKEYLAPEILRKKGYGMPVDWWSLGVLCYEFSVGRPPFMSRNMMEIFDKILHCEVAFPPQVAVPDDAKDLIIKLLNKDPEKRLGSVTMGGVEAIKAHPFFNSIDWDKLYNKEIPAPNLPEIESETDTAHFDKVFTNEQARVSTIEQPDFSDEGRFRGFTYDATDPAAPK
eukprot:JP446106.1.p1 GENE.JP446106.1~~JP446106.1.p1  ORF type:complete len:503 (-),score=136.94 JP446106.1:90-1598(-)